MNRLLILGVNGMLGSALWRHFAAHPAYQLTGTVRKPNPALTGTAPEGAVIIDGIDAFSIDTVDSVIRKVRPQVVINCIGIIKQLKEATDPVTSITVNALFPHQLARMCGAAGARLVHISTDCVFSGLRGNYAEADPSDATDLYGRTKYLGELSAYDHCVTLRTSIIGHELGTRFGLVEWFLAQEGQVKGFRKAIYSGFPTVEIARIIESCVIPDPSLRGLYQVASAPINKYDLLQLVAETYGKRITILPDDAFTCDRSMDGQRFSAATGYQAPAWPELVRRMHEDYNRVFSYKPQA
jgi:dTDP-4-dehydrorhamnose reductase